MIRKRENIQWAAVVWKKMPCWCQRRMGRLFRDDRKATVTQITTRYSQDMQNTSLNAEAEEDHTGYRSCQIRTGNGGYNYTGSPKLDNRRLENVAWSDESLFLLHSDGRVRIWRLEHESMDPFCLVSMVQDGGGGNGVGDIFLAHFGPLSTNWASFKHTQPTWVLLLTMSIPLWLQCTHLLMSTSSRIMHHVTKLKSSQMVSWTWQWVHFTQMTSTVTRSQSNRAPLGCGGTGDSHHGGAADKSAATVWWYHINMTKISE